MIAFLIDWIRILMWFIIILICTMFSTRVTNVSPSLSTFTLYLFSARGKVPCQRASLPLQGSIRMTICLYVRDRVSGIGRWIEKQILRWDDKSLSSL